MPGVSSPPMNVSGWLVTFCVFVQFFIIFGPLFNYSILFVSLREEFQSSAALTGWVGSLANGLMNFVGPLAAVLLRRYSHRAVVMLGITLFSLGLLTTSFVPSIYWAFLTLGIVSAFGAGFEIHTGTCLVLEWFPRKHNSRAVCLALLGTSAGLLAVAPLLNYLIVAYGWRNALRIVSGGSLVIGIIDALFLVHPPAQERQPGEDNSEKTNPTTSLTPAEMQTDSEQIQKVDKATDVYKEIEIVEADGTAGFEECKDKSTGVTGPSERGFREILREFDAWLFGCSVAFAMIGWTFVVINFASFMKIELGFNVDETSLVLVLFGIAEVFGKLLTALFGDHLPFLQIIVLAVCSVLGAVVAGLMTLVDGLTDMIIISMAFGVLRAMFFGISISSSFELFGEYGGNIVTSVVLIPWGIGTLVAAQITGGLFDLSGNYTLSLFSLVVLYALSALCLVAINLRRKVTIWKWRTRQENDATDLKPEDEIPSMDAGRENKAYDVREG